MAASRLAEAVGGDPTYTPGNQTGSELKYSDWYPLSWDYVIRPYDYRLGEKMAQWAMRFVSCKKIGYSQQDRNSLLFQWREHGFHMDEYAPCNCDCSSMVSMCAIAAYNDFIAELYAGDNLPWTGNIWDKFRKTGEFLKLEKFVCTSGTSLLRGDILVNTKKHAAIAITNGGSTPYSELESAVDCEGDSCDLTYTEYTVRPGDSWWGIAWDHSIDMNELLRFNGHAYPNDVPVIHPGDVLKLPL